MSLATNVADLATRIATEFKLIKTYISGSGTGDVSGLDTTATNLVDAINEIFGSVGGPISLDDLDDVIITGTPGLDSLIGYDSGDWINSSPAGWMGRRSIDELGDVNLDGTQTEGQALVWDDTAEEWIAGDVSPVIADASETVKGIIEIATQGETNTGTDDVRAITPLKFQTRLAAYAQPLDSDLTSIAALTTTSYGRALLELANQAALMGLLRDATDTLKGIVELATDAEAVTGTDTTRATTPANVKAAIDAVLAASNTMTYKGVIDCSANPNYPAANAGDWYLVSVAGKIGGASGIDVEVGDMAICKTDGSAAGNEATVGANWNIIQKNIIGAVTGPASSASGNVASFNGTSGKIVQDSGVAFSTDGTMASNSDAKAPTEKAVVTYAQPKDTDLTAIAALTSAANKGLQSTGAGTWALYDLTAAGKALLDDATASDQLTTLGVSTFVKTILDDADAAAVRATISTYSQAEIGSPTTDFVATFEAGLL